MKYLFGYKPGKIISEQDIDYTTDDYLDVNETELDEYYYFPTDDDSNHSKHPERLVKHNDTNKIVGTFKHGKGFHPSSHGEELGFEHHPTRIPHGTRFGGTEVGNFDYEDDKYEN